MQQRRSLTKRNIPDLTSVLDSSPGYIKTSAQIIEEARQSVRLVETRRPLTPAGGGRSLYSGNTRNRISRPSSNISLGRPAFLEEPVQSIYGHTLEPLEHEVPMMSSVPPTPIQSVVDIHSTATPTTPDKLTDHTHIQSSTSTPNKIPELKTCTSPKTSKRVLLAESNRLTPDKISRRGLVSEHKKGTKREAVRIWDQQVQPLLDELDKFVDEKTNEKFDELLELCDKLWTVINENGFHGNTAGLAGKSRRSALLRCLFQLLNVKNPAVTVKLLTIILTMKVVGGNLLKVCQHVFALCRNEENDQYFITGDILGPLVDILSTSDPAANIEACVFGLGAIKLLSSNSTLRSNLNSVGVVKMIADYLRKCCGLLSILRNLSDSPDMCQEFLFHDIVTLVSLTMVDNKDNSEVVYYASRFFSKLTLHSDCVQSLTQCEKYISMIPELLVKHNHNEDTIVRLYFILGNLTSTNPHLSHQLYHTHQLHPSIDETLTYYFKALKSETQQNDTAAIKQKDVLVKVLRLIANICVNQSVAIEFSQQLNSLHLLLEITSHLMSSGDITNTEELVVNTLVVFNNLSYYASDIGTDLLKGLANVIVGLLLVNNDTILMECIRVLGNISKYPEVREIMDHNRVNELLVTLLDSNKVELVYSTCGVLVNVTGDPQYKSVLRAHHGIKKLTDVLSHYGRQDWQLSSLVCKILCNYSGGESFTEEEVSNITHLLEEYLDPVTAFTAYLLEEDGNEDQDDSVSESRCHGDKSQTHTMWETEFSPVAQFLLKRLEPSSIN